MDFRNAKIFPCKKIGVSEDGFVTNICYEIIYEEENQIMIKGIPLPIEFDNGCSEEDLLDPINILYKGTIKDIIWRNTCCDNEDLILFIEKSLEWATDTIVPEDAKKYLSELKKELKK